MDSFLTTQTYPDVGADFSSLLNMGNNQDTDPIVYKDTIEDKRLEDLRAFYMDFIGDKRKTSMNQSVAFNESDDDPHVWDFNSGPPPLTSASIAGIVLGILGLIANMSTLIAIGRIRINLTGNLRLIASLCSSDMLVSLSILLKLTHKQNQHRLAKALDVCLDQTFRGIRMTSHIISLLNLVGLALDHYFAITKPLKYPMLMRKRHANMMIVFFWFFSALCGFSDFIIPSRYFSYCDKDSISNYCESVHCSVFNEEYIMFTVAFISCAMMIILYAIIFIQITRYQAFQNMFRQNAKRNRRGLITTIVIVATFMVTWLPYCLFDVILIVSNRTRPQHYLYYFRLSRYVEWHFYNLLLLNSLLDPIIYAIRMREVQNGYRNFCICCGPLRKHASRGMSMSGGEKRSSIHQATMTGYVKPNQSESFV